MIRPIEMQMLLPRTESMGQTQQHEQQHNVNVNTNAANEVVKYEQRLSETVVQKQEKEYDTYRYDASEERNQKQSKKKRHNQDSSNSEQEEKKEGSLSENKKDDKDFQPRINFQI